MFDLVYMKNNNEIVINLNSKKILNLKKIKIIQLQIIEYTNLLKSNGINVADKR